jgi:hypothetical protein
VVAIANRIHAESDCIATESESCIGIRLKHPTRGDSNAALRAPVKIPEENHTVFFSKRTEFFSNFLR